MVYCIYLGICLHGSVYIIFNISVLNYMENSMSVFSCRCDFSWWFNTDREKNFPDGPLSTGKSPPTRKNIFPWWEEIDRENRHRQGKTIFYGVQTVRVNDIIACRFCTAKEFYFLVGNPFFLTVSTVREKRFFLTVSQLTCGLSTVRKLKSYFPDGTPSGK